MSSLIFYHPMVWRHFKNIVRSNPEIDSAVADKIMDFTPTDKTDDTLFWTTRLLSGSSAVDRTGKLNKFNVAYSPIPELNSAFDKTFGQICLETAENFWKRTNQISVMWSGGIDSTAAALALIETKPAGADLEIKCTHESILEYPAFYKMHQSLCQVQSAEQFFGLDNLIPDRLILTGDVADQLFGANMSRHYGPDNAVNKDAAWTSVFETADPFKAKKFTNPKFAQVAKTWSRVELDNFVEKVESQASACPFPVKSLFDMLWWLSFSTKFNYSTIRIPLLILEHSGKHIRQIDLSARTAFYLNDDFQRWSLCNHDIKMSTTANSYKQPAKDFIFSINGDADYATNKLKEASTNKMLTKDWWGDWKANPDANYAILNDGSIFNSANHMSKETLTSLFSDSN